MSDGRMLKIFCVFRVTHFTDAVVNCRCVRVHSNTNNECVNVNVM